MKTIYEILQQIQGDAESDLPDILYEHGLEEFGVYEIGQSRDDKKISFLVYQDKVSHDEYENRIMLVYQLQLPGVTVLTAALYADAVMQWVKNYDWSRIGMLMADSIDIDTWPNSRDRLTAVFFDVVVIEKLDSCD